MGTFWVFGYELSAVLSNLHYTFPEDNFEEFSSKKKFSNNFRILSKNVQDFWRKVFVSFVKTAFCVFRGTF